MYKIIEINSQGREYTYTRKTKEETIEHYEALIANIEKFDMRLNLYLIIDNGVARSYYSKGNTNKSKYWESQMKGEVR